MNDLSFIIVLLGNTGLMFVLFLFTLRMGGYNEDKYDVSIGGLECLKEQEENLEKLQQEIQELKKEKKAYQETYWNCKEKYHELKHQETHNKDDTKRIQEANTHLTEKLNEIMETNKKLRNNNKGMLSKLVTIQDLCNCLPYNQEYPTREILKICKEEIEES